MIRRGRIESIPHITDASDRFEVEIFFLGWAAEVVDRLHRVIYRAEREASEWFDIGGESA